MSATEPILTPSIDPMLDREAVENARLVREGRARLLTEAGAVTLPMLAQGRASSDGAARQWVHRKRAAGRLVTVDIGDHLLIPTFQLDEAFDLDPAVAAVVAELTAAGMSSWAVWRWFETNNGFLDTTPREALRDGGRTVLDRSIRALVDG